MIDEYGIAYNSQSAPNGFIFNDLNAHHFAPLPGEKNFKFYNYERMNARPPEPNDNLTNLDEIVNWYVGFYKLNE